MFFKINVIKFIFLLIDYRFEFRKYGKNSRAVKVRKIYVYFIW